MTDLKEVARLAGVSRATAARTFATPEVVRPATREQVFAAASAPTTWAANCACSRPT